MNQRLLSGPVPWSQRLIAGLVALVGVAAAAILVVFSFVVGAALIGGVALFALGAYVRFRFGKPMFLRNIRAPAAERANAGNIIDAEYEVVRRESR